MAKFKHNKKKNTAFLYETLILELTKAILKRDISLKNKITKIIKEAFHHSTALYSELKLYDALAKTENVRVTTAEKIIIEVKKSRINIDKKRLLVEQNNLSRKIKKDLSDEVMNNFVPNYKSFATIYQIFNQNVPIKTRVLLENEIINKMSISIEAANKKKMVPVDNLIYKTFTKKFNKEYSTDLLKEQKELLSKFISSFMNNSLQLKSFLNDELGRLKEELRASLSKEEIMNDKNMFDQTQKIIALLESYKKKQPEKKMIQQVIKVQGLVHEINKDAAN
tara:strand:+ start:639 stop:1478 length:840 start_codon:yes stop_codon:yes gene_type:complete